MSKDFEPGNLIKEAEQTQYALRSSFFYRLHGVWDALLSLVEEHSSKKLDWRARKALGISTAAWDKVALEMVSPALVFCHPSVITSEPRLIAYYRCLALLPQKGMQRLASSTQRQEDGKSGIDHERASAVAKAVNEILSLLIESDPDWKLECARTAAIMNYGTQVNGSWRNAIGEEGANRVKDLLVSHLVGSNVVREVAISNGARVAMSTSPPAVSDMRALILKTGYVVAFGSEPDVSIRDAHRTLVGTIEVKYGLDPAGALERYGAAMRSFQAAVRENARVINIYLASCFTPELRRRMNEDRLVNQDFNLLEVLGDKDRRLRFLDYVRRLVGL